MVRRFRPTSEPTDVVIGAGASERVAEELESRGLRRALVLSSLGRRGPAAHVAAALGDLSAGVLSIAEEHVPVSVAEDGRRAAAEFSADALVPVGGGSTIGLAKAIALTHDATIVAVPTTYSGSEMTPIYGITENGVKRTGRAPRVLAACVLYDPVLSRRLSPEIAVPSAFNALAHAVEALYAPEADEALETLAEDAVRSLAAVLPGLAAGSDDLELRERALHGACLAGACLARASMGLHHRLCHVLGGTFGLPHAETHAALLPHVARFNLPGAPRARAALVRALGAEDPETALAALLRSTPFHRGLAALGLSRTDLPKVADLAVQTPYPNPRPITRAELLSLLEAALDE